MHNLRITFVGLAVAGLAGRVAAQSKSPVQPAEAKGQTHSIALPQIPPPPLPDGPNKEKFEVDCSTCHSLRYMTMQPRFSKKVWTSEVQKMIDTYKAQFAKEDVEPIVAYLVSAHGTK